MPRNVSDAITLFLQGFDNFSGKSVINWNQIKIKLIGGQSSYICVSGPSLYYVNIGTDGVINMAIFADVQYYLQGLPSGFDIMYLALADRNLQVRFALK